MLSIIIIIPIVLVDISADVYVLLARVVLGVVYRIYIDIKWQQSVEIFITIWYMYANTFGVHDKLHFCCKIALKVQFITYPSIYFLWYDGKKCKF